MALQGTLVLTLRRRTRPPTMAAGFLAVRALLSGPCCRALPRHLQAQKTKVSSEMRSNTFRPSPRASFPQYSRQMIGSVLHALITLMEITFKLIALVIAIPVYALAWIVA